MRHAVVELRYPVGIVPVKGFRCPVCGEEEMPLAEVGRAQRLAAELGLYGIEHARERRLQRTGNSVTVSLDPFLLKEVLGGAGPGTVVQVGKQGDRIVITAAERGEA